MKGRMTGAGTRFTGRMLVARRVKKKEKRSKRGTWNVDRSGEEGKIGGVVDLEKGDRKHQTMDNQHTTGGK